MTNFSYTSNVSSRLVHPIWRTVVSAKDQGGAFQSSGRGNANSPWWSLECDPLDALHALSDLFDYIVNRFRLDLRPSLQLVLDCACHGACTFYLVTLGEVLDPCSWLCLSRRLHLLLGCAWTGACTFYLVIIGLLVALFKCT